jgi:LacI family transcriptional regulator
MRSRGRRTTILDVARKAGVSVGSVSNAINGTRPVSPELQQQVAAAARDLGYQINSVAQTLRRRHSKLIGLCTTHLTTVYLRELADALDEIATENGYELIQMLTRQEPERELQRVRSLMGRQVDGLILLPSLEPQAALDAIAAARTPAVVVDRLSEDRRFDYVIVDNRQAMIEVVGRLRRRGHDRILFVAQNLDVVTTRHRLAGLEDEARASAGEMRYEAIERGRDETAYQRRLRRILTRPEAPTAIVTGNSSVALSTIKALQQIGLVWPDDVALVTFDDPEWATVLERPLSTVRSPTRKIAEVVWALLHERINGGAPPPQVVALPAEVVERRSSLPPRAPDDAATG